MTTERLYYNDSYVREFSAEVLEVDGLTAYLDRTAFYPSSGGQPFDIGTLGGIRVVDVVDEEFRIAHKLEAPIAVGPVTADIDWNRRFDHMQQHTGQHLLSSVFEELFAFKTLSFHMGADVSTIELGTGALDPTQVLKAERRANELVAENRHVTVSYEDASVAGGLRKASERQGTLRIVDLDGLDRSACGGTHVRNTGEIGIILIRKLEKVRANIRLEFVCGLRAVQRARTDFDALSSISRVFSCAFDEAPRIAAAQVEKVQELDKARRMMAAELAKLEGEALRSATAASAGGVYGAVRRGPISEDTRTLANAFTAPGKAIVLQLCDDPPSVFLAASKDSGFHCGEVLKKVLAEAGGRGGGSAVSAQGSVPSREALTLVEERILAAWPS